MTPGGRAAPRGLTTALIAACLLLLVGLPSVCGQADFTIDPSSVPAATRYAWCIAEQNSCSILCTDQEDNNNNQCNTETLEYKCICISGYSPQLRYYADTMPSLICNQTYNNCLTENSASPAGQKNCTDTIGNFCGKLTPTPLDQSSSSSSSLPPTSSLSSTATSQSSTSPTNSSASNTGSDNPTAETSSGLSSGATAGIAVGASIGGLVFLAAVGCLTYRAYKRRRAGGPETDGFYKPELDGMQIGRHQAPWVNESGGAEVVELAAPYRDAEVKLTVPPVEMADTSRPGELGSLEERHVPGGLHGQDQLHDVR
ncbi:hypothetical protein GQ53DRAFT_763234 [Thozetella sp. PMI_491]|nr:hypothetical protein GQ53DRAFT_763234 [Thozetella sp. PMI_491]